MLVVQRFAGILLQVQALDADLDLLEAAGRSGPTDTTTPSPTIGCLYWEI